MNTSNAAHELPALSDAGRLHPTPHAPVGSRATENEIYVTLMRLVSSSALMPIRAGLCITKQ